MDPERQQPSEASRALTHGGKRGTAGSHVMHATKAGAMRLPSDSPFDTTASPAPRTPMYEQDEEENSYDKNDTMPEEGMGDAYAPEVEGKYIDVFYDGNSGEANCSVPVRGRKRQRGVKVGPKVAVQVQSSSKQTSDVWNFFEKVPLPSTKEKDVMILKARCLFCKKLYSYTQGGCTSHLGRHKRACATYKNVMAKKDNQALLNFAPSSAESTFNTGGRVLDDYRSSLQPAMVEALVCAPSWIRGAHNDKKVVMSVEEDDEDDVELILFPQSVVESN